MVLAAVVAQVLAVADGGAVSAPRMTASRVGHMGQLDGDWGVLICGGVAGVAGPCERYLIDENRWVAGPPLASSHAYTPSVMLLDGRFLLVDFGTCEWELLQNGTFFCGTGGPQNDLITLSTLSSGEVLAAGVGGAWLFPADGGAWQTLATVPAYLKEHATVVQPGDRTLVIGGIDGTTPVDPVRELLTPRGTWTARGQLAQGRGRHVAARLADGSILVAGGVGAGGSLLSTERSFDQGATWRDAGTRTLTHLEAFAVLMPNDVLLVGGRGDTRTELFDPVDGWRLGGPRANDFAIATLLPTGRVLFAGQTNTQLMDLFVPVSVDTPAASAARSGAAMVQLSSGDLWLTGGLLMSGPIADTERFAAATRQWTAGKTLPAPRAGHTATRLRDGTVLIAGGGPAATLLFFESFDVMVQTPPLAEPRAGHRAELLDDGRVIVVGGTAADGGLLVTTELFDPARGSWAPGPPLPARRSGFSLTVLRTGQLLLAGGMIGGTATASTLLLDRAAAGPWAAGPSMGRARTRHTATLQPAGSVLIFGGSDGVTELAGAERLQGAQFFDAGTLSTPRADHAAMLLHSGLVLFANGVTTGGSAPATAELYDPVAGGTFATVPMKSGRVLPSLGLLPSGHVLIAGGGRAEINLVDEGRGRTQRVPRLGAMGPVRPGDTVTWSGSGLRGDTSGTGNTVYSSPADLPLLSLVRDDGELVRLRSLRWSDTSVTTTIPPALPPGQWWVRVALLGVVSEAVPLWVGGVDGQSCADAGECVSLRCSMGQCVPTLAAPDAGRPDGGGEPDGGQPDGGGELDGGHPDGGPAGSDGGAGPRHYAVGCGCGATPAGGFAFVLSGLLTVLCRRRRAALRRMK